MKRIAMAVLTLGLIATLTGCGSPGPSDRGSRSSEPPTASAPSDGKEVTVHMVSMKFDRATLEVPAGTTVRSANLSTGKSFAYRFDKPGTYEIFCNTGSHHLIGMKMNVVVN